MKVVMILFEVCNEEGFFVFGGGFIGEDGHMAEILGCDGFVDCVGSFV